MCDHANREAAMVTLVPGTPERHGRDGVWCDPCLAPIVGALNAGGVRTVASCCGHGQDPGWVALDDDRVLVICESLDDAHRATDALTSTATNVPAQAATRTPVTLTGGGVSC